MRESSTAVSGQRATDEHAQPGLYSFPTAGRWWSANRTPLVPGFVTESLDGEPVAPLMGSYPGYDVGTLRVRTVPNLWSHASADHAVVTQLLPDGPEATLVSVYWLVDDGAVEGRDYESRAPAPVLAAHQRAGLGACASAIMPACAAPRTLPGPYSPSREYNVAAFVEWYLERLATSE